MRHCVTEMRPNQLMVAEVEILWRIMHAMSLYHTPSPTLCACYKPYILIILYISPICQKKHFARYKSFYAYFFLVSCNNKIVT